MNVFVLTVSGESFTIVRVATTRAMLIAALVEFCRANWEVERIGAEIPDSDLDVIDTYFDVMTRIRGDEFWRIDETPLLVSEGARPMLVHSAEVELMVAALKLYGQLDSAREGLPSDLLNFESQIRFDQALVSRLTDHIAAAADSSGDSDQGDANPAG